MEFKNTLNKIKALLSMEVKLEQMKLVDGVTTLEAEAFEPDYSVGIVTSEGIVPAPVGEYETVDGMIVVVEVEGIIKEVKPVTPEEETAETPAEVAAEPAEQMAVPTKIVDTITKETFFEEVKVEVEKLEAENKALKVELEALKLELEEAGAKAIVHNPETKEKSISEMSALEKHRLFRKSLNNN
jgi:regulator of replication initiation timing